MTPQQVARFENMRREHRAPAGRDAKAGWGHASYNERAVAFSVNIAASDWITKPLVYNAFGTVNPTALQSVATAGIYKISKDPNNDWRYRLRWPNQRVVNPWPFAIDSNTAKNGLVFVERVGRGDSPQYWVVTHVQNLFIVGNGIATATATGETSGYFDWISDFTGTTVGELVLTGGGYQAIKFLGNALDLWCDVSFTANFVFDNSGGNPGTKTVVVTAGGQTLVGGTIAVVPGQTTGSCSGRCLAQLSKDDEIRVVYGGSASLDTFGSLGGPTPAFCKLVIKPVLD